MSLEKRQALQTTLEALVPYWDIAEGFLLLLQEGGNDELIEQLYKQIINEIKNIKSKSQQEKIKNVLKDLREKSNRAIKEDEEGAEQLLKDFIDNIE